jgi:hypothetical protein
MNTWLLFGKVRPIPLPDLGRILNLHFVNSIGNGIRKIGEGHN